MGPIVWLIAAVLLGLLELLTVDLTFLMLSGGALAASVVAFAAPEASWYWSVGVFSLVSVALLFLVRPRLRRHLEEKLPKLQTNASGLVGLNAVVLREVTTRDGLVKLSGQDWTARTIEGVLPVGSTVQVTAIDGATAVVTAMPQMVKTPSNGEEK
ncbi:hypothetical protein BK816_05390 [Boudabousia tangfeifanii]|uniref:NfeD-like C-terminal domain-containing protein n=1 Tax=Boudabousia tangfeifanii TaxID=1912795 RepID=A0A1D9MKG0_9ACTO|nr:NfeD family protein [Boudabousia tangfeifanii]AOZ72797.1 hypothetical protein BK816_05390 [Boudabousia tangfeifanii]